ncbi:MAG: hypothetical protein ACAI38_12855 [Myxococcota bacterium]
MKTITPLVIALAFAACGDSDDDNTPLISGSVTGTYGDDTFTLRNGVLGKTSGGSDVVILGTDAMTCASPKAPAPPEGNFASIAVGVLAVGTYGGVLVQVYENHDDFSGAGSSTGTFTIDDLTDTTMSASVSFSATVDGKALALNGDFEVERCAN